MVGTLLLDIPMFMRRTSWHYNAVRILVRYKSQYFANPHGQSVDWDKDDVSKFSGVLTACHLNELNEMLPL
jgi:hypothetical protein